LTTSPGVITRACRGASVSRRASYA
jgi:hypothetical protein